LNKWGTELSVFRRRNKRLSPHFEHLPAHCSESRTPLSVFRRRNKQLPSPFEYLPAHFSKSRTHYKTSCVTKVILDLANFAQADLSEPFLK
jgi:hypothetical protein